MSFATWIRFVDFCIATIESRSAFEATTLATILYCLEELDRERVLNEISIRLATSNPQLYRWFFLDVVSAHLGYEERASIAETLNTNIALIQSIEKYEA